MEAQLGYVHKKYAMYTQYTCQTVLTVVKTYDEMGSHVQF